jgi:hypothetical protein
VLRRPCDAEKVRRRIPGQLQALRRIDANGDKRFWMLETIREFAREHLAASGEEDALRRLQTDWLIELADRAGMRATVGVPGKWDVDLVAPEIDNVRAVLDWAAEHDPERGLALAASLEGFWLVREPSEGASRLEPLLARTTDAEPELRAHALRALGGALQLSGEPERAAPYYQHSLELFIASGDEVQTANLRYRVAGNMVDRGEKAAAWPLLEASLRTFRQLGLPRGEAQVLGYLAEKPHGEGDLARVIELTLESAAVAREIGWATGFLLFSSSRPAGPPAATRESRRPGGAPSARALAAGERRRRHRRSRDPGSRRRSAGGAAT